MIFFLRLYKKLKNRKLYNIPEGNTLNIIKEDGSLYKCNKIIPGLSIKIEGTGNNITIKKPFKFTGSTIEIHSNNNTINIDKNFCSNVFLEIFIANGDQQKLIIGNNTVSNISLIHLCHEGTTVSIGSDCLFARDLAIYAHGGHSILDGQINEILNEDPCDLIIEDPVWIGYHATLLKGTHISKDSLVAAGSIVNKKFMETNVAIGGNPAKIIKRNINWDVRNPEHLKEGL